MLCIRKSVRYRRLLVACREQERHASLSQSIRYGKNHHIAYVNVEHGCVYIRCRCNKIQRIL